ncbi:MAG: LysM peptidoglycan-binding domain-containing protein [Chloroflexi bacterium]|nr:LysM peptidoglycan-binding domain-containing protein [Chloroflexota bacterium]
MNTYRASLGLSRLVTSSALMVAAQRHAAWMAVNYTYSHSGEGGSRPQDRASAAGFSGSVSENVAGGTWATPAEAVFFWDQSSVHRSTMRLTGATHIGGGFAANSEQRLFVLLIGSMPGQAPLPTGAPLAGGTPAIDFTPPPGMVWESDGVQHRQSDYVPSAPGTLDYIEPTVVAYVMPFESILRSEPGLDGSVVHVVEAGQTAWAIAARYGVEVADLLAINHLPESPILHPGEEIIIQLGEGQVPPPAPTSPTVVEVRAGESLWIIAARYGISVEDLRAWNGLDNSSVILPGMSLVIAAPGISSPMPTFMTLPVAGSPTSALTATPLSATPAAIQTIVFPVLTETLISSAPAAQVVQASTLPPLTEIAEQPPAPLPREDALVLLLLSGILAGALLFIAGGVAVWFVRASRRW